MTSYRRSPQSTRDAAVQQLCSAWFGERLRLVRPGPPTGFSGTRLAIVELPDSGEVFVIKAFRPGVPRDRAAWVHGFMQQARAAGVREVPDLAVTRDGETLVEDTAGVWWEAVRFVEGTAVATPSAGQVTGGMELLAHLHLALEQLAGTPPATGVSTGVQRRLEQAARLRAAPWSSLGRAAEARHADALPLARAVCERLHRAGEFWTAADGPRVLDGILAYPRTVHTLQPVLRDVWSDHVLFAGPDSDRVVGLVDFHAADVDVPATDIARLLGTWQPPAGRGGLPVVDRWPEALSAYERIRPLPPGSRDFITWLEATGVVCGLDNWFRWVLAEGRLFSAAAVGRVDQLLGGLPAAVEILSKCGDETGLTPRNCSL